MRILFIVFTLLAISKVSAQSTLIVYNYHDETYKFYKITRNGDTITTKRPYSLNGIPVKIVVKDLNTFCYTVTFTAKSFEEIPINSDQNVETLVTGFGKNMGAFNDLVDDVKANSVYQSLFENGEFQGLDGLKNAFGMAPGEFEKEYEMLEAQSVVLDDANSEMTKASVKIESVLDFIQLTEFTHRELEKLKLNPNLTEAEMKTRANALVLKIFDNSAELEQVINISNAKSAELEKQVGIYFSAYNSFDNNAELLKYSITNLEAKVKNDNFKMSVDNLSKNVEQRHIQAKSNYSELQEVLQKDINGEIRSKLMEVYTTYDDIQNADFNYEYSVNTEQDVTQLTMKFGQQAMDTVAVVKTRSLNIPTMGGLRINSSVGMSFISYFNGQSTYFNNNGVIGEEKGDLFLPALTTMFHFYRQTYKPFTVGGSFGLSVPIEGEKDFIYMTGISGIIGKTQRVVINAGAFGGRTTRLDQGLRAGDELNSFDSEVPVKRVFDFGIYMGLTFNINSLF